MRASIKLLALALSAALQPAVADVVTLDFEDITATTRVLDRYEGLTFTNNAWGVSANDLASADPVCKGKYLFEPLAKAERNCGALLLGTGTTGTSTVDFTITSEFGFVDSISFAYALGATVGAKIEIFDAAGALLKGQDLSGSTCDSGFFFCNWQVGDPIFFSGTARSIVVTAKDQKLMLDDLQVSTAAVTPGRLPEPGSIALAFGALGALGWSRKRAAR
ncbi:MAG: hypothetical protein EOP38_21800 [Rubrivivax sp.]|nr:MAG: hypothetical protein EOP38_21800 [Rubrivivax sp.]